MRTVGWRRLAGFTLVEVLVTMLIMGILAVGGYPLLMGYAEEAQLEQEARLIYQDLCLVRDTALTVGEGTATMRFLPMAGGGPDDRGGYEMINPAGDNVRTALMDECAGGFWQRNLASRSVCLVATAAQLEFDREGRLRGPADAAVLLEARFWYAGQRRQLGDRQYWAIRIEANSASMAIFPVTE